MHIHKQMHICMHHLCMNANITYACTHALHHTIIHRRHYHLQFIKLIADLGMPNLFNYPPDDASVLA